MKPITFENLRRLVGGGRKKKEKESSFKRSDSFKRISIRKSYLDRGKKKQISKLEVATQTVAEEDLFKLIETTSKVDSSVQVDKTDWNNDVTFSSSTSSLLSSPPTSSTSLTVVETNNKSSSSVVATSGCVSAISPLIVNNKAKKTDCKSGPGQSVIAYGQWLKGIRKDDGAVTSNGGGSSGSSGIKGAERTVIYVPASDEIRPCSPNNIIIQELTASPVFPRRKSPIIKRRNSPTLLLQRKESNDSAVEMFPWGDSVDVKKSPIIVRRKSRQSPPAPLMPHDSGTEEMCSLSISLGRIWMDAPQGMAPRSLEMPKPSGSSSAPPPVHHSLDSALKDLRDDPIVINRLQKRPTPPVARTLSSTSNTTVSTGLFSSKDSGFSFSTSGPKINDLAVVASSTPSSRGFFRKKKPKPKLSVSRDGYFKRTSGAALVETKRNSVRRRSSRKKKSNKLPKVNGKKMRNTTSSSPRNDLYQVVVSRPPRSLRSLKLDPMIFVPPEKRKTCVNRKQSFKIGMREIRNLSPVDTSIYTTTARSVNESADEGLYESLPGEYDDMSDEQPLSGRISRISLREEEDDIGVGDDDDDGDEDEDDYDLPSITPLSEESIVLGVESPLASEDDEITESLKSDIIGPYIVPGVSPKPRRKPVRRKKSALSHKKSITYVVKPNIMRAPSTLRRPIKKFGDITQKGYEKKRTRLLAPYVPKQNSNVGDGQPIKDANNKGVSPTTRALRKGNRRLTRNESRYHSGKCERDAACRKS